MRLVERFRHLAGLARRHGVVRLAGLVAEASVDRWHERRFAISTSGTISARQLLPGDVDAVDYSPISYSAVAAALRHVHVHRRHEESFLDYGAGKGRAMIVAARRPFRRVLGIELSADLARCARENIAAAARFLQCQDVQVVNANAAEQPLPDDVTVIHLYNPFRGRTLERVMAHWRESMVARPRAVTVLFANPDDFERLLATSSALSPQWLRARKRIQWPFAERVARPGNCYYVYTFDSRPRA